MVKKSVKQIQLYSRHAIVACRLKNANEGEAEFIFRVIKSLVGHFCTKSTILTKDISVYIFFNAEAIS